MIKIKCTNPECEYKVNGRNLCDLNEDERADCCPLNGMEEKHG